MLPEQLRTALGELNGQRDVHVVFDAAVDCHVRNAFLVPAEADNILKLTDGALGVPHRREAGGLGAELARAVKVTLGPAAAT
jgi:hypothetical protein